MFLTSFFVGSVGFIKKNCFLKRQPEGCKNKEMNEKQFCCNPSLDKVASQEPFFLVLKETYRIYSPISRAIFPTN